MDQTRGVGGSWVDEPWDPMDVGEVVALLSDAPGLWWLSGGEGIDRWLGRRSREHGDIDVSVARTDAASLLGHVARTLDVLVASDGVLSPWHAGSRAVENTWCRDRPRPRWRLQVNVEEVAGGTWSYRRDPRVQRRVAEVVLPLGGVPTVAPAVQLLWKAAGPRAVDERDLAAVLPLLPPSEVSWLRSAVATAHPESPWRARLDRT